MKKMYLFLFMSFPFFIQAQITLTSSDMPQAGDMVATVGCDIPPGFSIGSAGANQTYDFTSVIQVDTTAISYISPNGTAGFSEFPNATLATEEDGDFIYFQQTNDAFLILGSHLDTSANGIGQYETYKFNPTQKVFEFPTTYNTSYTDNSALTATLEGDGMFADSIRATTTFDADSNFDGYGTINTPNGSFACVREFRIQTSTTTTEILSLGMWTVFSTNVMVDTTYNWFANNSKGPIASASINNGVITDVDYSTQSITVLTPVASFSSTDQGGGMFDFTDESTNSPTSWMWDFGDGNTSTQQNPSHTYAAPGVYMVCLTAANSAGSNTVCMNVTIVFAPTAAFNFMVQAGGVVDFMDASSNNPTTYLWDFGDGNTSTDQNPQYTYADPGDYNVCLTVTNSAGSNTTCMTVTIVLAPVADFSFTVQVDSGTADFVDESTNSPTSWMWDFGDGNTSTDQNPQHVFTSTNMFNVCLTATNSAGSDMKCAMVDVVITATEDLQKLVNVDVFPNPVSQTLNIRFENQDREELVFQIVNILGQPVKQINVQSIGSYQVDLKNLSSGIYYFVFKDENGIIRKQGSLMKED